MEHEEAPDLVAQLDHLCLAHVASYLASRRDLASLGLTCQRLNALIRSEQHLWQVALYAEFGLVLKVGRNALRCARMSHQGCSSSSG